MFKKSNRLTKTKDIERVFKNGRSYYNQLLGIKALNNSLDYNRFAVVVNLKVSKQAVIRNRLKRQMRAVLQAELATLKPGFDLVIIALPTLAAANYQDIEQALKGCLQKLKLY